MHDVFWEEDIKPMRKKFKANDKAAGKKTEQDWQPQRVVKAPGAFIMPVGPVFSGEEESVQFQLETIREEIIWSIPTLFYKYRGVEKIAEDQTVNDVLLLAERFAGTTAFAHAFAFCRAVEQVCNIEVPKRAMALRVFLAELERFQHHIGVIEGICNSTGLVVAANQAAILEEDAQRIRSDIGSHRYFFGLAVPGGLSRDIDDRACKETVAIVKDIANRLNKLEKLLINSNSFLDRIEEIGVINKNQAHTITGWPVQWPAVRVTVMTCGKNNHTRVMTSIILKFPVN